MTNGNYINLSSRISDKLSQLLVCTPEPDCDHAPNNSLLIDLSNKVQIEIYRKLQNKIFQRFYINLQERLVTNLIKE